MQFFSMGINPWATDPAEEMQIAAPDAEAVSILEAGTRYGGSPRPNGAWKKVPMANPSDGEIVPMEWPWMENTMVYPIFRCTHIHPHSSTFIHIHPYSSIFIHIHPYSSIFIHIHPYSISLKENVAQWNRNRIQCKFAAGSYFVQWF